MDKMRGGNPSLFFCLGVPPTVAAARISRNCAPCTNPRAKVCVFCLLLLSRNYAIIVSEGEGKHQEAPRARQKTIIKCNGCSLVERIPPCVPPHSFEPSSPHCSLCLRLGRQRDDVRSSRTADKIFFKKFQKKY